MTLDTRTILTLDTVIVLAFAAALQFYRKSQRTYPGFGHWVLGTTVMGAGYLAMVFRPVIGEQPSVFITNVAFICAALARLDGTSRFTADRPLRPAWYLTSLLAGAVCLVPSVFVLASTRSLVSGVGIGTIASIIGVLFIRHAPPVRGMPYRVIGAMHLVFATIVTTRSIVWAFEPQVRLLDASPLHSVFFVSVGVFEAWWGVAFIMMNANRLEAELRESQERLTATVAELQAALGEVRTLSGLLPVCCSCQRIRDDEGYWKQLQEYLTDHQGVQFSHGICPECCAKLYPDI